MSSGEKLSEEKLFLTKYRIQQYVTITFLVIGNLYEYQVNFAYKNLVTIC